MDLPSKRYQPLYRRRIPSDTTLTIREDLVDRVQSLESKLHRIDELQREVADDLFHLAIDKESRHTAGKALETPVQSPFWTVLEDLVWPKDIGLFGQSGPDDDLEKRIIALGYRLF